MAESVVSTSRWAKIQSLLPAGYALPESVWTQRHRIVVGFVFAHAVGLPIFGLIQGWNPILCFGEGALIALLGVIALPKRLSRGFRSASAALGAVTSSAVLTQFWGGYIEAHFHYFVVVALIALYQDWIPFLLAIGYVAVDHGVIGSLYPEWVYNHAAAQQNPWGWAVIHAVLVLAECALLIVLWKSNERARAQTDLVLSSATEGILGLELNGRVSFANPSASAMLGRRGADLRGESIDTILASKSAGPAADILRVFREGKITTGSGQVELLVDGRSTPVEWSISPVREGQALVGSVLTLADASERVQAQKEREKRLQQVTELERLKELDKFKTLFINTAAHELHTPLTPLRLNVYALKEGHKGELNARQMSAVDVLDRNVERLGRLVEDVLNVARLEGNRMVLDKRGMDISETVLEAVDSFRESATAAGVHLEAAVPKGLYVMGDSKRLSQVLFNLLDNAIKFTPSGGRVQVEARRDQGGIKVLVHDTGVGLKLDDVAKLFRPFSQAHSPMERTRAGSGLGLYISKGIVELHGGHIGCDVAGPGKGTTFWFYLVGLEATTTAPSAAHA